MLTKTIVRYQLTPVRTAIIVKKTNNNKCWQGWRDKATLVHTGGNVNWLLKKLKIELPYDPAIPLLGIHPKKRKTLIWKDICTPIFIEALFTIAKIWKQPKCPASEEWIKKITYEYYSARKKNEILPFTATWMDLEGITLSEVSQTEKDKYCIFLLICGIWKIKRMNIIKQKKTHRYTKQTSGYQWGEGWGRRKIGEGD